MSSSSEVVTLASVTTDQQADAIGDVVRIATVWQKSPNHWHVRSLNETPHQSVSGANPEGAIFTAMKVPMDEGCHRKKPRLVPKTLVASHTRNKCKTDKEWIVFGGIFSWLNQNTTENCVPICNNNTGRFARSTLNQHPEKPSQNAPALEQM